MTIETLKRPDESNDVLRDFYDQETGKIVDILKLAEPERIIRFGSIAHGMPHPDSDIDLCVIMKRTDDQPPIRVAQALYRLLREHGYRFLVDVELHVYYEDDYEDQLRRNDPFLREIEQGEVLYDARPHPSALRESLSTYEGKQPNRHRELARAWMANAESDLAYARLGFKGGFYSQACFSCQQVAEKALKAYLFAQGQPLTRTHNLPRLLDICRQFDETFRTLGQACDLLSGYYIDTRYPRAVPAAALFDRTMAAEAIDLADQVLAFVRDRIGQLLAGKPEGDEDERPSKDQ